jgi:predicted SAM-dependent methyltransferase
MNTITYELPPGPKLNLGCGPVQPEGWVNIDASNRARLASRLPLVDRIMTRSGLIPPTEFGRHVKVHNLCKPLPYADGSVSCIYAGEVWEHFSYADTERLTADCFRVLAAGGVLRVCVPDGPTFWRDYLDLYEQISKQPPGERSAKPLRDQIHMYFKDICTKRIWLGSMGHTHKWQFDDIQLVELFQSNGFLEVERMPFHTSRISDIQNVERSDFLIVEGIKPDQK